MGEPQSGPAGILGDAVRALEPVADVSGLLPVTHLSPSDFEKASAALSLPAAAWVIEETNAAVETIASSYPGVPDLPMDAIGRATESTLFHICTRLTGALVTDRFTHHYRGFARDAARRGTHPKLIVDVMRTVQQRWVGSFLTTLGPSPELVALQQILTATAEAFDAAVDTVTSEYLAEREQVLAGQLAWRRATVEAICDGTAVDADLIRSHLGIDIEQHHVGLVLWFPGLAAGYELERVAKQIAGHFSMASPLTVAADNGQVWMWLSFTESPAVDSLDRLTRLELSVPGVRVAFGPPANGVDGFRRSHWQARDVADVARSAASPAACSSWNGDALITLLGHDLERARWFVCSVLGPLARQNAAAHEQRATLRSYLDTNHSLVQTAVAQHVHRNTVVYRVGRIEDALGHPLLEHRTELRCALQLVDYFGPRVLCH